MRRRMYAWLNGPGRVFENPLLGSTNYLGAYDKSGNLIRGRDNPREENTNEDLPSLEADAEAEANDEMRERKDRTDEDKVDALEEEVQRQEKAGKSREGKDDDGALSRETMEDLRPFPLNKQFRSQPVLSEELREAIYNEVVARGISLPTVSVQFGVSNERVAAVVRLKQMEKEWIGQGKKLAAPYSKAVLAMLPQTPYVRQGKGERPVPHEPINDLPVHPATRQQLFVPVSESRNFTREDAARAFDETLLTADKRIPHPELVIVERERLAGISNEERVRLAAARMELEKRRKEKVEKKRQDELNKTQTVPGRRWDFVFKDISVENVGPDGRDPRGVGWRYGVPHQDRKKGQVKIPTRVDG